MNDRSTYNPAFFERLKRAEEQHFWFHARRKWIFDRIRSVIPPPARVLEIGCGTGNVSSFLSSQGYDVTGCDPYAEAIGRAWPGFRMVRGDLTHLSFKDDSFDIIGLFDVVEHFDDDITPLREAARLARGGGIIALTVPARQDLWSREDELSLHRRRYSKDRCRSILLEADLKPLSVEYIFMSLYPPMKYLRTGNKMRDDYFRINRAVNILLKALFDTERMVSHRISLPVGTSIVAIAERP